MTLRFFTVGAAICLLSFVMSNDVDVCFRTGRNETAGTNANVFLQIVGDNATSEWLQVEDPLTDEFQSGSKDCFKFTDLDYLGKKIDSINVRVSGESDDWYLSKVKVFFNQNCYKFRFGTWLTSEANYQSRDASVCGYRRRPATS